jgi:hypothetical protein
LKLNEHVSVGQVFGSIRYSDITRTYNVGYCVWGAGNTLGPHCTVRCHSLRAAQRKFHKIIEQHNEAK